MYTWSPPSAIFVGLRVSYFKIHWPIAQTGFAVGFLLYLQVPRKLKPSQLDGKEKG